MSERGPYLQFDCPLCWRPRLLHHYDEGSDRIDCEKCGMEWEDEAAVVQFARLDAARHLANVLSVRLMGGTPEHASAPGWAQHIADLPDAELLRIIGTPSHA